MGPVWLYASRRLRRRRGEVVALALLIAVAGGVVLAAVAGARRTDTAMARFLRANRPADVEVVTDDPAVRSRLAELPDVAGVSHQPSLFFSPSASGAGAGRLNIFGVVERDGFVDHDRPIVVAGRLFHPERPFEVVINESTRRRDHLDVGSTLRLHGYTLQEAVQQATSSTANLPRPAGPVYTFRVVGVVRQPPDVNPVATRPDVVYQGQDDVYATPALVRRLAVDLGVPTVDGLPALPGTDLHEVRLAHGQRDAAAFTTEVRRRFGNAVALGNEPAARAAARRVERATRVQAVALLIFAGLAAVAGLLVVGQAFSRWLRTDTADEATLRSLGMPGTQRAATALVEAAVIGVGGGLLAVAVAVALSPLTPVGLARQAEVDPGVRADWPVLLAGLAAIVLLVVAPAAVRARRLRRAPAPSDLVVGRVSWLAERASRAGLGPAAAAGAHLSLDPGRNTTAVPLATALLGALAAVIGLVAALTFGLSLDRLVGTWREQGWNWDVVVGNPTVRADPTTAVVPLLRRSPVVGGFSSIATFDGISVGGARVPAAAVQPFDGSVFPRVLAGQAPQAPDEVALARDTMRRAGRSIGDTVLLRDGARRVPARVVGEVLMPSAGDVFDASLSDGAVLTLAGARRLDPGVVPKLFLVRYRPGVAPAAGYVALRRDFGPVVLRPVRAPDVENLRRVDSLPFLLAVLLVVLAVATLAHTLLTSVRRRGRDVAVWKTLGFVRRQVSAAVAWQATALALTALVVGIPLGVAAGRWTWRAVADQLGAVSDPVVPVLAVGLLVPAALVAANLAAGVPGWLAARLPPAAELRRE